MSAVDPSSRPSESSPDRSSFSRRRAPLFEIGNHVLTPELDRVHDFLVRYVVNLHEAEQLLAARLLVALDLPDAGLGVAADDHVVLIHEVEVDGGRIRSE